MASGNQNPWNPPVAFHFRVVFQWEDNDRASASFAEVDGLSQELALTSADGWGKDGFPGLPTDVKVSDITLNRSLEPLDERITKWVTQSFNVLNSGWIDPCRLIISLLDEEGKATAAWLCMRAIPVKWKLGALNASESKLAVESITIRSTSLKRTK